jgi:hypothetical protein
VVKRYQVPVSTYVLTLLLCALTAKGWFLLAWVAAGCAADRQYVYVDHNGRTEAIDARLWPILQLNPKNRGR